MTDLGRYVVTRADIARLAGVQRPAVSNWERRYGDFPAPTRSPDHPGVDVFRADRIAVWLDRRKIQSSGRRDWEPAGTTFGDRFRRALGDRRFITSEFVHHLLARQDRFRGEIASDEYLKLLLALVYAWGRSGTDATRGEAYQEALGLFDFAPRIAGHRETADLADFVFQQVPARREECAAVFDLLLDHYRSTQGRRDGGEFFTPRSVARTMARLLAAAGHPPERVHDPFCRAGEVLTALLAELPAQAEPLVTGSAPGVDALALARMNLTLHGAEEAALRHRMEIEDPFAGPGEGHGADWVATNPPFGFKLSDEARERWGRPWPYGPPGSRGDLAWLQHVVESLAPGGRAAVVMPNGAGFAGGRAQTVRARMVHDGVVECVMELPPHLFSDTAIPVSIWMLTRPRPGTRRRDVLFVDGSALGAMTGPASREFTDADIAALVGAYSTWRNGGDGADPGGAASDVPSVPFRALGLDEIREWEYRLTPHALVGPDTPFAAPDSTGQSLGRRLERLEAAVERLRELSDEAARLGTVERWTAAPAADGGPSESYPPGWREATLGELAEITTGPGGKWPEGTGEPSAGVPVVRARHVSGHRILHGDTGTVPWEEAEAHPRYRLRAGDLVMTRSGTVGRCALVTAAEDGWLFGTHLVRIRPHSPVWSDYLLGFLTRPGTQDWIDRRAAGTTGVRHVSAKSLAGLPVLLPPEDERERIGRLLHRLDERRRVHTSVVATLDEYRAELADLLLSGRVRPDDQD
ncbi:N-6 DNA methylase [Streptomyces clavuligerus]|uniref:N-6 DNA methylase n=1 Tax=Streptomyces clavuligerus TaxID=1901 RepID=E2PWV6_STRCL|nr:N-6 DNA methylase [Streptomyces clavuligerus]ANW19145.1 N-6 DNA methylase [Streptomyces clavuligerus]AXU13729.1 N-6 DNA methylase [Streptomyces clavuligerus]EFG08105.1 N-6 DNA methylase [Streptomyces clavuligerus]MBY6303704.1 N-6 DNA methylase [Streptomyces clavuligerus]QCS06515.1 N-6 DNA methylase [Streptomyces clavuligerus]